MKSRTIRVPHGTGEVSLHYLEWGSAKAERVAVCVHGISRNAHDFRWLGDCLAEAGWRVLSFDMVGRGKSEWLADPKGYIVPVYVQHMVHAMSRLGLENVDWIGTSMGGLIGMGLAVSNAPLRSLVLNDVGPFISAGALAGIAAAVAHPPSLVSVAEVVGYLKGRFTPYGPVSDAQWQELAAGSVRKDADGTLRLHYDPAISAPMEGITPADVDLWGLYDRIKVPVMALRGAVSPILDQPTAEAMTHRGPHAMLFTFHNITHPLWLADNEQMHLVRDWLLGHPRGEDLPD
ncbi:MAG: alpha/beta hydrolase [Proteobacteria bacterium]|nr:alpha/beta hydrolase [Pseudomonadota bacterium]